MFILGGFRNIKALFLFMLVVNMFAGNYYLQREFLEPLRERASFATPSLFAENSGEHGIGDYKPPKSSYSHHEFLSDPSNLANPALPAVSRLDWAEPSGSAAAVYLDIITPPKI